MIKDYIIEKTLGKGSYGIVYKVQKKNTNEIYVIKQIPLKGLTTKEITEVRQEAKILYSINSDFVVKYYDSFEENNKINIVMEYCDEGDLNDFITKKKNENKFIEEDLIWNIFIKITIGLAHIHKMKILHRDLKTMNIFLKSGFQVKIGDLGVAKILLKNSFAKTLIGTPYYLSPEICKEIPYNNKSDVWALGCILYELCTFKHPFDAKNQGALILKIMSNKPQNIDNYYSKELNDLIFLLLEKDSQKRPSCRDILQNDFIIKKIKNFGFNNYLKELDIEKNEIKNDKEKIDQKQNINSNNKVKITTKIIKINIDNENQNNNNKIFKNNIIKENSKKIMNNINNLNKNKNSDQNNIQRKKGNEIKINEIVLGNNPNKFNNRPVSNRYSNNHLLYNNFFINNEKNKYNKKLSNVINSKNNNNDILSPRKNEINNKLVKINQFKIELNIPDKPRKTSNNFFQRKNIFVKNNEKRLSAKDIKGKQPIIKKDIDIKKVLPKYKYHNEIFNPKETKKQINSGKAKPQRKKQDIIKYQKMKSSEDFINMDKKYLINILNKKDNFENNNNIPKLKDDKENLDVQFEIINNKSNGEFESINKGKSYELKDSIYEYNLHNQKNRSHLSSKNNSNNSIKIESDISNEYEDENVKEIKESKNQESQNLSELKLSNKNEEFKEDIIDSETKIKIN